MIPFVPPSLLPAFPEIILTVMAIILLLIGVVKKEDGCRLITNFAIFALIAVMALTVKFFGGRVETFNGMFVTDNFAVYAKILMLAGAASALFIGARYVETQRISRFEYPVLVVFSTIGMMLMISANDLMSLYMSIELQSLPLYVLAASRRESVRSTEAGLKYFILGALSSGMLLYGASLVYGFTGSTNFNTIAATLGDLEVVPVGVIAGMVFLLSGIAFKLAAAPFHMWAPDVYEGAPTSVTAFFAIAPKIAAVALLTRVLTGPFADVQDQWQQVVIAISVLSMLVGSVAAVAQTNIKRLLAYSAIGHIGYALIGLAAAGSDGVKGVLVYITIYMISSIGTFAVVLMMKNKDRMLENISDLSGLASRQPMVAFAMAALMFSMAGIPPLAGFFAKLFVFQAAVNAGLFTLAVFGVLTSVVSAYYYLRIVKVMYFDPAAEEGIEPSMDSRLNLALLVTTVIVVLFAAFPVPLIGFAETASSALLK